ALHAGRLGKGECGGAASMTLEVLHGALVLLGRRARPERAEIAATARLRVDFARIEAKATRLELADHRRLPRAACALRMLRVRARRMAGVGFLRSGTFGRSLALKRSPPTCRGGAPKISRSLRASAVSGTSLPPTRWACSLLMSHFCVSQEPLGRLPATRSRPPFLPTS